MRYLLLLIPALCLVLQTHTIAAGNDFPGKMAEQETEKREAVERVLIHLRNIPEGSKNIPGSDGVVTLERRRYRIESQTLDAMAGFFDVPVAPGYTVTGRHRTRNLAFNNPVELWGIWKEVDISPVRNEFTFVRHMPYLLDVRASYVRGNSANPSLQKGEDLTFDLSFRNPSADSYKSDVVILLKNIRTGEETRLEKEIQIKPFERNGYATINFVANAPGEYHFAAGIFLKQRINEWTDCWDWSPNPLFYVTAEHRTLEFSGYSWDVKAGFGNPGANLWSNDTADVWVDENGKLNLSLPKKDNGRWYATEVISQETFDYGTFTFYLDAEPADYDPHVVAGIFLYRDEENEIDIEFSRWGDHENYQFGNYVLQPSDYPGNHFRFPVLTTGSYTTHRIVWKPDEILFSSWHGHWEEAPEGRIIAQWQYAGKHIPESNGLRLFFNIWLFKGIAPKTDKTEKLGVLRFTYEPLSKEQPDRN